MMLEDIESDDNLTDANRKIDDDGNDYRDVNVNAHNEDANADDVVIVEMEKNDATINMVDIDIDGDESDDNDADIPIVTATVVRFEEGVDLETQVVYSDDSEGGEVSVVSIPNEGATSASASLCIASSLVFTYPRFMPRKIGPTGFLIRILYRYLL